MPMKSTRLLRDAAGLWSFHLSDTHVHGLPHIHRSKSNLRKAFWSVIFIVMLIICFYHLSENFMKYRSYPVQTRVELVSAYSLPFPAVTICNNNPIRREGYQKLQEKYSAVHEDHGARADGVERVDPHTDEAGSEQEAPHFTDAEGNERVLTDEEFYYEDIFWQMTEQEKFEYGHQIDTMLLNCAFGELSIRCNSEDFFHTQNAYHGNCYTFNSGANNSTIREVRKVGIEYGLHLELFIESEEYILTANDATGVRVVVQNASYMPFPERDGINVSPGSSTYIGVNLVQMITTELPYDNCYVEDDYYRSVFNAWHLKYPHIGYTSTACALSCYQWLTYRECECGDAYFPLIYPLREDETIVELVNITVCRTEDELVCMDAMWNQFSHKKLNCSEFCRPLCNRTIHNTAVSYGGWPSIPKEAYVINALKKKSPSLDARLTDATIEEQVDYLRENTLKITIYYSDFEHERIITTPSYLWVNLLSDQGGQVGLWVGLSILSLFELFELVYDFAKISYSSTARQVQRQLSGNNYTPSEPDDNQNVTSAL